MRKLSPQMDGLCIADLRKSSKLMLFMSAETTGECTCIFENMCCVCV